MHVLGSRSALFRSSNIYRERGRDEQAALGRGYKAVSEQSPIDDAEERRAFARIEQALSELGNDYSPPQGWESRVLAAREPKPKPWWQRWQIWVLPAVPATAFAFALAFFLHGGQGGSGLPVAFSDEKIEVAYADGVAPTAKVMASDPKFLIPAKREMSFRLAGDEQYRALRVYRRGPLNYGEGSLVASCESERPSPTCTVSSDLLVARWSFPDLDQYRLLRVAGSTPIPPPQQTLDADLSALDKAGLKPKELRFEVESLNDARPPSP